MGYSYDVSPYARSFEQAASVTDQDILVGVMATLGAFLGIILLISLVIIVLQIIASWKIFKKAGEAGWKSLIPFYSTFVSFRIAGINPWLMFVYFAAIIPVVGGFISIALHIYFSYMLAKSFGKEIGYTIGLILLPTVFYLILGLSSIEYVGPGGNPNDKNNPIDVTANN